MRSKERTGQGELHEDIAKIFRGRKDDVTAPSSVKVRLAMNPPPASSRPPHHPSSAVGVDPPVPLFARRTAWAPGRSRGFTAPPPPPPSAPSRLLKRSPGLWCVSGRWWIRAAASCHACGADAMGRGSCWGRAPLPGVSLPRSGARSTSAAEVAGWGAASAAVGVAAALAPRHNLCIARAATPQRTARAGPRRRTQRGCFMRG